MIHAPGGACKDQRPPEGLRVLVPYVPGMLRPQTQTAVREQWPDAWFHELVATDQTAYTRLLLEEWDHDVTTIVIEQDIVPSPGTIQCLYRCTMPWCTVPYLINGRLEDRALGCAKFSRTLKAIQARVLHRVARYHGGRGAPVTWHNLDQVVASALIAAGVGVHVHTHHTADHLHDYTKESPSAQ